MLESEQDLLGSPGGQLFPRTKALLAFVHHTLGTASGYMRGHVVCDGSFPIPLHHLCSHLLISPGLHSPCCIRAAQ